MTSRPFHIIQKSLLDITVPDIGAALNWQTKSSRSFVDVICTQIERCFSEYEQSDHHLIIEKVVVDLGALPMGSLEKELPERFYSLFSEMLRERWSISSNAGSFRATEEVIKEDQSNEDRLLYQHDNNNQITDDRLYSGKHARLESLFVFLSKGYLPWWATKLDEWDEKWLQELTATELNEFKNFLRSEGEIPVLRLATQFSNEFLSVLLQRMGVTAETKQGWYWLENLLHILPVKKHPAFERSERQHLSTLPVFTSAKLNLLTLRKQYWLLWIAHAAGRSTAPTLNDILSEHKPLFHLIALLFRDRSFYESNFSLPGDIPVSWKQELESQHEQSNWKEDQMIQPEESAITNGKLKEWLMVPGADPVPLSNERLKKSNKKNSTEASQEMIFVNNAGLILLHPFLPQLFQNCNWWDKENFKDALAETMAVHALHYLATGKTGAAEHELLLAKLLMGIAWETPLEPVEPLVEADRAECDELLGHVVKHWEALRNTSIDGLREAFLQRDGKLECIEGNWRLYVEHKTQDILLNRIPWGYSYIKLPWMKDMLSITWQ